MADTIVSHKELIEALRELRESCTTSYKSGRLENPAAFVRAGVLIADAEAMYTRPAVDADAAFDALLKEVRS